MDDPYTLALPNLRALFLPDPGYALVEGDLARADAQVIAWEADARALKDALRADADIHTENALLLYGRHINVNALHSNGMSYRDCAKRFVHATNFAGQARTLSSVLVLPIEHVHRTQQHWLLEKHPEIGRFHRRLAFDLASRKNPIITNRFGFRRVYAGGDRQSNLLGQALAWIAQSTVACVINRALIAVDETLPEMELLLQIHDSILGQVRLNTLNDDFIQKFKRAMTVRVPYDDPLEIGVDVKWSAQNWGSMEPWRGVAVSEAA